MIKWENSNPEIRTPMRYLMLATGMLAVIGVSMSLGLLGSC